MINVKVRAGSKENGVVFKDGVYVVSTKSPAKEGKANESVVTLLSDYFEVPKSSIHIKSGLKSKNKLIEIL